MPGVNAEAMSRHLVEISSQVTPGAHAVLVLDGAGWHQQGGRLKIPDNLSLLLLPPYAPELNPVENIWQYLRANRLAITVWDTAEQILDTCCQAWNALINEPGRIASIATRQWATVNN